MKKFGLLILFIALPTIAQEAVDRELLLRQRDPHSLSPKTINDNPRIYLENESLLRDTDEDMGLYEDAYYTGVDTDRFSLAYHFSSDYEDFNKVSSLEITYMKKLQHYTGVWLSFMAKRTTAKYDAIAEELTSVSGDENADANTTRAQAKQSFTTLGLGAGFRFQILGHVFKSHRVFETTNAYLNYNFHLDSKTSTKYNGPGLMMDYGIHYRATKSFFYGAKLSYNLATVVREAKAEEKKEDRSLVFGWTALGFEIGYYY